MDHDRTANIICEKPPAIVRHVDLVVENNIVTNQGPFASIKFPNELHRTIQNVDIIKYLNPSVKGTGMRVGIIEKHPTEKSFAALVQLLKDADPGKAPKLLYEKGKNTTPKIRKILDNIASVIVMDHVGGNQLTLMTLKKAGTAPSYEIDRAEVLKLSGRNVLLLQGAFANSEKRFLFDQEIFVPDLKSKQTYNLSVFARSKEEYDKLAGPFKDTMNSVKWSSTE